MVPGKFILIDLKSSPLTDIRFSRMLDSLRLVPNLHLYDLESNSLNLGPLYLTFLTLVSALEDPCSGYCSPVPRPPQHTSLLGGCQLMRAQSWLPCWEFLWPQGTALLKITSLPGPRTGRGRNVEPRLLVPEAQSQHQSLCSHHQSRSRCLEDSGGTTARAFMEVCQLGVGTRAGNGSNRVQATLPLVLL